MNEVVDLQARRVAVEAQIAKKQGKTARRSTALPALLKERAKLQDELEV